MNMNESDSEYYLTMNHFSHVDFNKKLSESDNSGSDDSSNYNSSDNNSSDNVSGSGSESETNTEHFNNDSGSDSDSSEFEESIESENMEINKDDLFNTKTNGNEYYGEVLKNRYLILKKLGYGSFSSVWMAYDVDENKLVAIKIINPQDYKEGMLELQTYKKLDNLNNTYLLTMIECFQVTPIHSKYYEESYKEKHKKERNHIVMVLPLMACSTFDLLKCDQYEDGLPLEVCIKIIEQTLYGIRELEKHNMMHTDLKPENILVCGLNREAEILLQTIQDINIKNVHKQHLDKLLKTKPDVSNADIWLTSYKLYKEITKTIIRFMKNDMQEIKKQMKSCKVSSALIKDIHIKICDFNLVLDSDENIGDTTIEIQTRYYRAPEIILGSGLHPKTDYWSIGCILFELLTGDILFDPEKDELRSRDIHHMYLIEELMGPVPKNMLAESENYSDLYDVNGHLINVGKKVKRWDLQNVISDNYDNVGIDNITITNIIRFINATLSTNPESRPNLKTMLYALKHINVPYESVNKKKKNNSTQQNNSIQPNNLSVQGNKIYLAARK